ncbi:MAG: hypothetical protein ACF8XB_09440 [Planctomycetota bacterium JB042]
MVDKGNDGKERVARRLSAVKVVVDLFHHELDLGKADKAVSIDRERFDAAVTLLEDFVTDVDHILRGGADDRRVVESSRATVNRVN